MLLHSCSPYSRMDSHVRMSLEACFETLWRPSGGLVGASEWLEPEMVHGYLFLLSQAPLQTLGHSVTSHLETVT